MTDEERKEVEYQTRMRCARIAAMESNYWAGVDSESPHMPDIAMGALGAAANIAANLFMDRTEEQVSIEIEERGKVDYEAIEEELKK